MRVSAYHHGLMNLLAGKRVLVTGGSGFLGTPAIARFESL